MLVLKGRLCYCCLPWDVSSGTRRRTNSQYAVNMSAAVARRVAGGLRALADQIESQEELIANTADRIAVDFMMTRSAVIFDSCL